MQLGQRVDGSALPPIALWADPSWYTVKQWSGRLTYERESELIEQVVAECLRRRGDSGTWRGFRIVERMVLLELLANARVHGKDDGQQGPQVAMEARLYRNDSLELTVRNYIPTAAQGQLQRVLSHNRDLTYKQRKQLIINRMCSTDYVSTEGAGLGLLGTFDWAEIVWRFEPYDDQYTIFSIRMRVGGERIKKPIMRTLYIEPTNYSPMVTFDACTRVLTVRGVSRPQNTVDFFRPVMEWLEEFVTEELGRGIDIEPCRLVFDFDYFNSITSKYIMGIILKIKQLFPHDEGLFVQWLYTEGDEESRAVGEDMAYIAGVDFTLEERPERPQVL